MTTTCLLSCCLLALSIFQSQALKESPRHGVHNPILDDHYKNGLHNKEFDRLLFLGSKKAEEEFEDLEPDEARKHLAKLIPKMDLDKDGNLGLLELKSWVFNSYKSLDDEEAREEFKSIDENIDGNVNWDEYLKKVYSYSVQEYEEISKKNEPEMAEVIRMVTEDKDKFLAADLNKDGVLNNKEFPAFVHPHDYEFMHDLEIKHALKDHDKNKDGKIEFSEYKTDVEHEDPTEKIAEEVKFKNYDTNKDGFLDEKEMREWILPSTMQNAHEEAEHLISEADTDGDKILTLQEILDSYDTFVGSQATNYGRHLHLVKEEL